MKAPWSDWRAGRAMLHPMLVINNDISNALFLIAPVTHGVMVTGNVFPFASIFIHYQNNFLQLEDIKKRKRNEMKMKYKEK